MLTAGMCVCVCACGCEVLMSRNNLKRLLKSSMFENEKEKVWRKERLLFFVNLNLLDLKHDVF